MSEPMSTLADRARKVCDALTIVALTIWGECRNEPIEGKVAVAQVIANRKRDPAHRFGQSWQDVCLKPWQFSCWMPQGGERNYQRMTEMVDLLSGKQGRVYEATKGLPPFRECYWVALGIIGEDLKDPTNGANHYFASYIDPPSWADDEKLTVTIGAHKFYRL